MDYILFTGATGGLGSVCVKALSECGYTVFAAGTNTEMLAELARLPNVIPVRADVSDMESLQSARRTVEGYTGQLYAIVNFAGLTGFCSMVEGNCVELTERLLSVNVMGMVRVNRLFFDMVQACHGRIINCSSEAGWMTPQPFAAPYFLSKYAVEAYSDSLRRELIYLGIPVIKLQPGSFKTRLLDNINEQFEKTLSETRHYKKVLTRMKPLMTQELQGGSNPGKLAAVLVRAVNARHPRLAYRVGTGKLLAILEILPDRWLDVLYRSMMNR
ncbi:MAG: SDR family NAD(P)-dependent oxidoreductase [Eubacteriales bacterium]